VKERKPDKQVDTLEDELIRDLTPSKDLTKDVWPAKRQKLLLKHLGHNVSNLSNQEIEIKVKQVVKNFYTRTNR